MTKIYLIRHAEAEGNLYRRIHGHYNGDITPRGHKQIALLAERFRDVKIDAVYASDLQRTQKTAGAILKYHPLPLNIEPRLKEVDMGIWEDRPWGNISYEAPEQLLYFSNDPDQWDIAGGEPFAHLRSRLKDILTELAEKHAGETIACFSHGMAIRAFISAVKGVSSENIDEIAHGDNTCVAAITFSGSTINVEYYNDNSHLPPEMSTFAVQDWWKNGKKSDFTNLRLEPMALSSDAARYAACYRDGWVLAHGTHKGFSDEPYLLDADRVSGKNPLSLMQAFSGEDFAGIVELDTDRCAKESAGWISFLYLTPEFRGNNMGVQLIGHAVSVYRGLNRSALRLHVAEENKHAHAFYDRLGFRCIGTESGSLCPLRLMEMKL